MKSRGWVRTMTTAALLLAAAVAMVTTPAAAAAKRVLVYTRNYTPDGKGYVHANIADSVAAIEKLGRENGFDVDHSEDPAVFTKENLARYDAIVFSSSNNEAFSNDSQRLAFQGYIRGGGGFVGIHSATGSERNWPWFWEMIGGSFDSHPKLQKFTVHVVEQNFPATKGLPATFEWEDECYFHKHRNAKVHPLLVVDIRKLDDKNKADRAPQAKPEAMPLSWYHYFEGGRVYYLALGHKNEHYKDPLLLEQILGGIQWAMERSQKEASQ